MYSGLGVSGQGQRSMVGWGSMAEAWVWLMARMNLGQGLTRGSPCDGACCVPRVRVGIRVRGQVRGSVWGFLTGANSFQQVAPSRSQEAPSSTGAKVEAGMTRLIGRCLLPTSSLPPPPPTAPPLATG